MILITWRDSSEEDASVRLFFTNKDINSLSVDDRHAAVIAMIDKRAEEELEIGPYEWSDDEWKDFEKSVTWDWIDVSDIPILD
jgi:hypothetical protein